jgi:hypothetical protein
MDEPNNYRADQWLQAAASSALSCLIARLDSQLGARPYFWIDIRENPPGAHHSYWDSTDIAGRFVDGFILGRLITNRADHHYEEEQLRTLLFEQQGSPDGLFWNWEDVQPSNAEMSKYAPDAGVLTAQRHVDMFCQRSPLLAMTSMLAMGDESVTPRIRQMIGGLRSIAQQDGDEWRFPTYRWAPVVRPAWIHGESVPERWLGYRYALLTGLARYVQLTGDPPASELALGLARHYMRYGDVPLDGRYAANTHSGGVLPVAVGVARLGIWASDAEMVDWSRRVLDWTLQSIPEFGFLFDGLGLDGFFSTTCETCGLADLVHLALLLTEAGAGDYWDAIERIVRNQLLENQLRDSGKLRALFPGIEEPVLAMMHGGFECAAYPNRLLNYTGVEGCCIGGGLRALYLAWRAAVTEVDGQSSINLGFSRSTPFVEVIGHEPWRGRIDVRVRTPRRVRVRLPGGADPHQAMLQVDGRAVEEAWEGRYAVFDRLNPGQTASLIYPLAESDRNYWIGDAEYVGSWRGNTMLEISPRGGGYAIYDRRSVLQLDPLVSAALPWSDVPLPTVPQLW